MYTTVLSAQPLVVLNVMHCLSLYKACPMQKKLPDWFCGVGGWQRPIALKTKQVSNLQQLMCPCRPVQLYVAQGGANDETYGQPRAMSKVPPKVSLQHFLKHYFQLCVTPPHCHSALSLGLPHSPSVTGHFRLQKRETEREKEGWRGCDTCAQSCRNLKEAHKLRHGRLVSVYGRMC